MQSAAFASGHWSEQVGEPDVSAGSLSDTAGLAENTSENKFGDVVGQVPAPGTEVRLMQVELDKAIRELDLSLFEDWAAIRRQLRDPKLFSMDYDIRDFRIAPNGEFTGLADLMLTYRGDFLGSMEESLTLSAALSGVVNDGVPVITDLRVAL